jgi:3-hydroxymyristoyl/3-hydroxydecanoyl-(acyl carrier protein) dehydratase
MVQEATGQAHAAYLRLSQTLLNSFSATAAFQTTLLELLVRNGSQMPAPVVPPPPALDRQQCLEFAVGSIARVLGPDFAEIDPHPTRVRLPDEPLMLVDRILSIEGQPRSLTAGRVVTEHDIHADSWYLCSGRIPTCIAIEAGQADLFLSGYLGIDFQTHGLAVYRLLDAAVTFHRGLPGPGAVIRYDIRIERFFRQGDTYLFRFQFEGSVNGQPLLTMRNGCAGFFTAAELAAGKGVVQTTLDRRPQAGVQPDDASELPALEPASYDARQVEALRAGDLHACFGPAFAGLTLTPSLRLPGGRLKLVDRVTQLDPQGGRFGMGLIRAEADIDPQAWFLTCHFVDDQVMPGTLMYECCLHTLRIYLLRLGWIATGGEVLCEPVPGVPSQLRCRGQVTAATKTVTYEVVLKERGYRPEPFAIGDALMYADGKCVVEISNLCLQLTGLSREAIAELWQRRVSPPLFDRRHILAFATGKPSEAFGEPYRIFDEGRFIARLPGPPFSFIDRITQVEAPAFRMQTGSTSEAEHDVDPGHWYFASERQGVMPYSVLLEVALQACGWLAAYSGSALTSPTDLAFRNLEGEAHLAHLVEAAPATLKTRVRLTRVAASGGMIIQSYDFHVSGGGQSIYQGSTTFGFFSRQALAEQVGIREAQPYRPSAQEHQRGESFDFPRQPPFPDDSLRMIDRVELFVADGGPNGLGFIEGSKTVNPQEWFFQAHFFQDPVWPGSLGLEAFVQLVKVAAGKHWQLRPEERMVLAPGQTHRWRYRGQVTPSSRQVRVQALITAWDEAVRRVTADGFLMVDDRLIYQMSGFVLQISPCGQGAC